MSAVHIAPVPHAPSGDRLRVLGLGVAGTALLAGTGNVLGTLIAMGVAWSYMLPRGDLERGERALAQRELERAQRWLWRAGRSPFASRRVRARVHHLRARIHWLRGDRLAALEACEEAVGLGAGTMAALEEIQLLALEGRVEAAQRKLSRLHDRPETDGVNGTDDGPQRELELIHTRLAVAFHADDPTELPDDLVPWLAPVGHPERGATAVLLAWAFLQRRQTARAHRLIEEASDRLEPWALPQTDPKLHAFYLSQRPEGYRTGA